MLDCGTILTSGLCGCLQIYAFDRSFEGAIAACGAPLVGILAERVFGFKVQLETIPFLQSARHVLCSILLVCTIAKHHHHHSPDAHMLTSSHYCALEPLIPGWYQVPGGLRVSPCCRARPRSIQPMWTRIWGRRERWATHCCAAWPSLGPSVSSFTQARLLQTSGGITLLSPSTQACLPNLPGATMASNYGHGNLHITMC